MQNYLCSETVLQSLSVRKILRKHDANAQENNHAEVQSQQSYFVSTKSQNPNHAHMRPQKIGRKPTEHAFPGENLRGTTSVSQKELNYKKLLLTVVRKSLLTLKNK